MMSASDRRDYYEAVIQYAFTGEAPQLAGMAKNAFELSRTYLDGANTRQEKR